MDSSNNQILEKQNYQDELDNWFNDLDDKTIEIINNNLMNEEEEDLESSENKSELNDETINATTKCICIDDILEKNPETFSSNELIQYECSIAYFIQVLIEGSSNKIKTNKIHDTDLTFDKIKSIIEYLEWISISCEILAKRINQEILIYKYENKPSIIRSSYNFCTKYTQCKNFYSRHEIPNCKEHHYVHSLLKYDIDSVIVFLNYIIKNNISISKEELNNLYLSIKTICFVTRHMAKEISYIDYITKNNSELFHRNNPIELGKRKIIQKHTEKSKNYKNNLDNDSGNNFRNNVGNNFRNNVGNNFGNKRFGKNNLNKSTNEQKPLTYSTDFKKPVGFNIIKQADTTNRFSILSNF